MTLASHLCDGALGAWFRAGPVDHAVVTDRVADALRGRVPLRSSRRCSAGHGALVQATVRARLGLLVQHAPLYRALAGAHALGLAAPRELHALAARFPSHAGLDAGRRHSALRWRPAGDGWLDGGDPFTRASPAPRRLDGQVGHVVGTLLELLDDWAPPGRVGDEVCERELAAACAVAAAWTAGIPAGPRATATPHARAGMPSTPRTAVAGEAAELTALACETGLLTCLHRWAGRPASGVALGVADAVFVPGWAQGGMVVGRRAGGALLVDVLTTADPLRQLDRVARWSHHLVARAWLDTPERHGVTHVGLYLARHGVLVTWRVDELAAVWATGHADPGTAPPEFLGLATRAAAADGVSFRASRSGRRSLTTA